jgi:DNA-binding IclR family transcriptional regulator
MTPEMEKTSIERALEVLDLISEDRPTVSQEFVADKLELTRSTAYRYIKLLCDSGLLVQLSRGYYSLGPRIIELERMIRISDPVLTAGRHIMPKHLNAVPGSVLILCGLWGDRVICLHQEVAEEQEESGFAIRRARGLPFPLFKGAASLAILANLPNSRIKALYLRFAAQVAEAGLGASWAEFRKRMLTMRQDGHVVTEGTFKSGLVAVSAPVFIGDGQVVGSLTRVLKQGEPNDIRVVIEGVTGAARELAAQLHGTVQHVSGSTGAENAGLLESITA